MASKVKAGAAYVELLLNNSALTKGLAKARKQLQDFGNATRDIGSRLFGAGAAAAAPLGASLAVFASFDDAMRGVKAAVQGTDEEFAKLTATAKQLGATTSYTASQVASLMVELGRAGFSPDQVNEMTGAVLNLARATGTDATLSSGIMAATIRQFSLGAADATRVSDVLTAAANKTFNTVEALGEALKYAGPVAASANMSLEETAAILGTLGNMGIQGSEAGTALRRLLTLSGAEAKKFQDVFGVATTDAQGNVRSLVDVLGEVADATANMATGQKTAKFNEVFGLLGITSAGVIGKTAADTRKLRDELEQAAGIAAATAAEMDSGIGGAFRMVLSAAEGVAIAIGEALSGPMQILSQAISGVLTSVIKWIEENQRAVKIAALVAAGVMGAGAALIGLGTAFSLAGVAIGAVLSTLSFAGAAIGAIGAVIGALLSPIGLVSVAVIGLGGYLLKSTGAGGAALGWLGAQFEGLRSVATESFGAIGKALAAGDVGAAAKILWLTLKMEWLRGVAVLKAYWQGFSGWLRSAAASMIYGIAGVISDGWASIETAWTETIGFLADTWSLFTGTLAKTWHNTVGFIKKAWVRLKGLFDSDLDVDAEVRRIDGDTSAKTAAANEQMLGAIGARGQERAARRAEIERERQGREEGLAAMQASEEKRRAAESQAAIDRAAADLDVAKQEWKDAITALKESPAIEGAAGDQPAGTAKASTVTVGEGLRLRDDEEETSDKHTTAFLADFSARLAASGQAVAVESKAIESRSAFNAFSIRGLGADSLSDRQLRAAEQTAANTKQLIKTVEEAGLAYG